MKPHKWAKEIKAWADGAEIESKFSYIADEDDPEWYLDRFPDWDNEDIKFRIKPQPKEPQYLYAWLDKDRSEVQLEVDKPSGLLEDSLYKYIGKIKLETEND